MVLQAVRGQVEGSFCPLIYVFGESCQELNGGNAGFYFFLVFQRFKSATTVTARRSDAGFFFNPAE